LIKIFLLDIYRETIPSDAPPSYKGQAVKYSYKITIGTQRVNTVIKLLRVPFRVLSLSGNKCLEDKKNIRHLLFFKNNLYKFINLYNLYNFLYLQNCQRLQRAMIV